MNLNKKVLVGFALVGVLVWASVGMMAYLNQPDYSKMPPEIQRVLPLDKPTNIELEDDAGVSEPVRTNKRQRDPILNTWDTRNKQSR
jgi:hypothetical protein